ncbi:hypothetical protein C8Q74DRAFT_1159397, partial [Fomes fomentarius]
MANIHCITPHPSSLTDSLMSTMKILALIEDGSNWILYKAQFLAIIHTKRLRRYFEGREQKLVPLTAYSIDSDANKRYETTYDKWAANHAVIKTLLFQTAPEPLKLEIMALNDACTMWAIITSCYDNQGDFIQVNLAAQMQQLCCSKGEDLRPILVQLAHLPANYTATGGTLSDEQYKSTYFVPTDFAKVLSNGMPISLYTRLIDLGTSHHFEPHHNNFVMFREITPVPISSADSHKFYATGMGSI